MSRFLTKTSRNSVGASTSNKRKRFFSFALATVLMSTIVPVLSPSAANAAICSSNTITWDVATNGGSGITVSPTTSCFADDVQFGTLPTPSTKIGFTFKGWFATASGASQISSTSSTKSSKTYFAQWTAKTDNAVSYNNQGATTSQSGGSTTYTTDAAIATIPTTAPIKTGYTFAGWFTASSGGTQVTNGSFTPASPFGTVTLFAHWTRNTYAITFDATTNGGAAISALTTNINTGEAVGTLPTPAIRSGYTFTGWFTAASGGSSITSATIPTVATTYYAKWSRNTYTITFDATTNGGTAISPLTTNINTGDAVGSLPTPTTRTGYTFSGWFTAASGGPAISGATVPTDGTTYYAQWTAKAISLKVKTNPITTLKTVITKTDEDIDESELSTPSKEGCEFDGWYDTSDDHKISFTGGKYHHGKTDDFELEAHWKSCVYVITFDATTNGGTAISPLTVNVPTGSALGTLPTPALRTGYTFAGWFTLPTGGEEVTAATVPTVVTTYYARWTIHTHAVTYNGNGNTGGSVPTDASSPYNFGSTITTLGNTGSLVKTGYSFNGWNTLALGGGTSHAATSTFTMGDADVELFAQWLADGANAVNYDNHGATTGQTGGDSSYVTDGSFNLPTVDPIKTGYTFNGWFLAASGGTALGATYTPVSPYGTITMHAQWSANSLVVTYDSQGGSSVPNGSVKTDEQLVAPTDPTRDGYSFDGWFVASTGGSAITFPYTHGQTANFTLYAQWTVTGRTVTFHSNYLGGGTDYTQTSSNQTPLDLNTFTRTGYVFDFWSTNPTNGATYDDGDNYPFSQSHSDLYARWKAGEYTLTYHYDGATSGNTKVSDKFTTGDAGITLPAPSKTGYTFAGWYSDEALTNSISSPYSISANGDAYAKWTIHTHIVTYNGNGNTGGSAPTDTSSPYNFGSTVTVLGNSESLVKTGYSFNGWNTAVSGGTSQAAASTFVMGDADVELFAQWLADGDNAVTYNNHGATTGQTGGDNSYTTDGSFNLPTVDPIKTGYTFNGWFLAESGGSALGASYTPLTPFGPIEIHAQWSANVYNVTYNNHSATTPQSGGDATYTTNNSFNLPGTAPVKNGYTFNGWFLAASGGTALGSAYTPATPFGDIEIHAQWTEIIVPVLAPPAPVVFISVTYLANGGNGAAPTQANIPANGLFIVGTTMTRAGYTFGGWRDQSTTLYQAGVTYIAGPSNVVFTAQWNATSQTVTYLPGTGSGTVPTQGNVLTGGTFTVGNGAGLTKTGYTFVGWTDGTNNYAPGSTYTMGTGNVTLTANYLINNYAVSYTTDGNGSITGSTPQTVDYGNNGTSVTATPLAGYRFDSWSDGVTTATRSEANVVANVFATARFAAITFTVTYTAGPNGSINGNSPQVVQYAGNTSPVTATPATGYRFSGWSDGNINATRSDLNITAARSVTANFELIPPVALEVLPVVTPTPAPVVEEPTAAAPAPLILPQAVVATTKTACDKPILIDLSKNIAADGSSKVEISSLPKTGTLVQTSATTWTFTPAKNSCSLGGNDSIVFKITDKNGVVTTVTNNVVVSKQGNVPSAIHTGIPSFDSKKSNGVPMPELIGFAFLVLFSTIRRKFKKN